MAQFGLAIVPEAWHSEMPLEFTAAEYEQYSQVIEAGTRDRHLSDRAGEWDRRGRRGQR